MTESRAPLILLPGGGGEKELVKFKAKIEAETRFSLMAFPGWEPYVPHGFQAEVLIRDLIAHIEHAVPSGPIRIGGYSLGAHLGYMTALRLQAKGRDIAGFCAIDAPIRSHPLRQGLLLLREGRIRTLCRFAGLKIRNLAIKLSRQRARNPWHITNELEAEFASEPENAQAMIRWLFAAGPWILAIDTNPTGLRAPSVLVRTRPAAGDDRAWKARCPGIRVLEISGTHRTLLDAEHIEELGDAVISATRGWR